ncbi:hypothetical protein JL720_11257 [Aureococcus anophagefferens]|nr:hypothetical protein JL720_11257 [Aureococcus anophagefferens]
MFCCGSTDEQAPSSAPPQSPAAGKSDATLSTIEEECSGVTVTLTSDEGKTGSFEVFLGDALIHSKATKGQDKCESRGVQRAISAINGDD